MARPKKDGHFVNFYIENTLYDRLRAHAEEQGQTLTMAVERSIAEYLDRHAAKEEEKK